MCVCVCVCVCVLCVCEVVATIMAQSWPWGNQTRFFLKNIPLLPYTPFTSNNEELTSVTLYLEAYDHCIKTTVRNVWSIF